MQQTLIEFLQEMPSDLVKFTGVDDVLLMRRQHGPNLSLRAANAIPVHGMTSKRAGNKVWIFALAGNPFKKVNESLWIVAGRVFVLDAQEVGFALEIAAELHERDRNGDAGDLPSRQADRPAYEYQGY